MRRGSGRVDWNLASSSEEGREREKDENGVAESDRLDSACSSAEVRRVGTTSSEEKVFICTSQFSTLAAGITTIE